MNINDCQIHEVSTHHHSTAYIVRTPRKIPGMWNHDIKIKPRLRFELGDGTVTITNRGRVPYVDDMLDAIDALAEGGLIALNGGVIRRTYERAHIGTFGKGWGSKFGAYYAHKNVILNNDGYVTKVHMPTIEGKYNVFELSILYGLLKRLEEETADW